MLCDFCNEREAVIFLEQISGDGSKKKVNICMQCAMERGIGPDPKSIKSSIGALFNELASIRGRIKPSSRLCPVCGTKGSIIKNTGKAGCPECYSVFKDEINAYMIAHGIYGKYRGTMPERLSAFKSVLNDRMVLKNKLDEAVRNEDYERAAMYRDYLKALSKESVSGGEDGGKDNALHGEAK